MPVANNYDLEEISNSEANKVAEKYKNNPELLGFEDIKFRKVSDVQVKDY